MRLIKATALSILLGKSKPFVTQKYIRFNPIGVKTIDGVCYYNLDYAKCIAPALADLAKVDSADFIRKIDEYRP